MDTKSRARTWWPLIALGVLGLFAPMRAAGQAAAQAAPQNLPARVTLDEAIDLALKHNHSLQAARTTILQNQAQEITANLRPNPVLLGDAQFLPFFQPSNFTAITWTTAPNSTWASAICSSAARSGSTACRRPRTRRP